MVFGVGLGLKSASGTTIKSGPKLCGRGFLGCSFAPWEVALIDDSQPNDPQRLEQVWIVFARVRLMNWETFGDGPAFD
jgi:hypothetical protein